MDNLESGIEEAQKTFVKGRIVVAEGDELHDLIMQGVIDKPMMHGGVNGRYLAGWKLENDQPLELPEDTYIMIDHTFPHVSQWELAGHYVKLVGMCITKQHATFADYEEMING